MFRTSERLTVVWYTFIEEVESFLAVVNMDSTQTWTLVTIVACVWFLSIVYVSEVCTDLTFYFFIGLELQCLDGVCLAGVFSSKPAHCWQQVLCV